MNYSSTIPIILRLLLAGSLAAVIGSTSADSDDSNSTSARNVIQEHLDITQYDGPETCIACHDQEAHDALNSLHMKWSAPTPNLSNDDGTSIGKQDRAINTFCSYAPSSKGACYGCHVRADGNAGHEPDVNDVDCLMCHNDTYQRTFVMDFDNPVTAEKIDGTTQDYFFGLQDPVTGDYTTVPDYSKMPEGTTMVELAQNVHQPTRKSCLRCHAKAGGGDWTKRGDMGLNSAAPTVHEDIHMSPDAGGQDMSCVDCHQAQNHKMGGRGIDLRNGEIEAPKCTDFHNAAPHDDNKLNQHAQGQVACQTCHIPEFGKGGATEMSRDWLQPHWNPAFCNGQGGFVGHEIKLANVKPEYRFFDGTSYVYNVGETIAPGEGGEDGVYNMARANGSIFDGKSQIVPIKNHYSVMPLNDATQEIIPPEIMQMFMTGDFDNAVQAGMANAGYEGSYTMVPVNAEMLITHGVGPDDTALSCNDCHAGDGQTPDGSKRIPFAELGYHQWPSKVEECTLCHDKEEDGDWKRMHEKHKKKDVSCTSCHTSEPTGLVEAEETLCLECHDRESEDSLAKVHEKHTKENIACIQCHSF